MTRRFVTAVLVIVLALAGTVLRPTSAGAQGSLTLDGQSALVAGDGSFWLNLKWSGLTDGVAVGALIHGAVTEPEQLTEPPPEALNRLAPTPIDSLEMIAPGVWRLEVPLRSGSTKADEDRLFIPDAGVYPVTVEVRDADGLLLAALRTQLIRLPLETAEISVLEVSTVLTISPAEGLTVSQATSLLADHANGSVTVVLGEGVISQLENDPEAAKALAEAVAGRPVLAHPSIPLDPSALAEVNHVELFFSEQQSTMNRLRQLGLNPLDMVIVDTPLTIDGATAVRAVGSAGLDLGGEFARSGRVELPDAKLPIVTLDPADGGDVMSAHRLLAELTLQAASDATPVVLGGEGPGSLTPAAIDILFTALEQPGVLNPVALTDVIEDRSPLPLQPAERSAQNLVDIADDLDALTADLRTYRRVWVDGGTSPDEYQQELLGVVARNRNEESRQTAARSLAGRLQTELRFIDIGRSSSITMATQRSTFPVTVTNTSDGDREVELRFSSDKVAVAQQGQLVILPPGLSSIELDVEARALGDSPLDIELVVPHSETVLAESRIRIRSTAVPGLGLLLWGAGVAFLVGWWIVSISRGRNPSPTTLPT